MKTPSQEEPLRFDNISEAIADLQNLDRVDLNMGQIIEYGPGACYLIDSGALEIHFISERGRSFLPDGTYDIEGKRKSWMQLVFEEDHATYLSAIQQIANDRQEVLVEYRVGSSSESGLVPVKDYLAPLYGQHHELVGYVGRVIDDSFRAQTMDTLAKRSWKEVSLIASRRFLHDFNNMIAGIYSLSELYAIPGSDAKTMTDAMTHIRDSSIRAQKITQKIRALTAMNEGEESFFDVGKLIQEQRDYLLAILPKTVDLKYTLSEESLPVRLDANRFRQALIHLAANASDAANDKPCIQIRCRSVGPAESKSGVPSAVIEFIDDGCGMESQTLSLVTNPFYTTKDTNTHAGMGLFIVDQFAKDLGGDLSILSSEGDGTQVSLSIPLANLNETISLTNASYKQNPAFPVSKSERKPTILIYTWEDIARHPLIYSIRNAEWKFRIHLDGDQLQLDIRDFGEKLDGVLVFKSALDEKVDNLVLTLAEIVPLPNIAVVALGESVDAVSENIRSKCGLIVSGSSKPAGLLKTLGKYFS